MSDQRRRIVAGNWKMHLVAAEAEAFARELESRSSAGDPEVLLFPSAPLLPVLGRVLASRAVAFGGQDLHPAVAGAHTGDVSGRQIRDAGAQWVLCGHSERRRDHGEDDATVAAKVAAAVREGLTPMLCIGETGEERRAGRTEAVLTRQLEAVVGPSCPVGLVVAYEPVWAIGTGETATPEQAQAAHRFVRSELVRLVGEEGGALRILYGGSVKPGNAAELIAGPDLDGFLVGGASLDLGSFLAIIKACRSEQGGRRVD